MSLCPLPLIWPGHHGHNNRVCAQKGASPSCARERFPDGKVQGIQGSHLIPRRAIPCWEPFLLGTNKPGSQVVSLDRLGAVRKLEPHPRSRVRGISRCFLTDPAPANVAREAGGGRAGLLHPSGSAGLPAPSAGHWGTHQIFRRAEHSPKRCLLSMAQHQPQEAAEGL